MACDDVLSLQDLQTAKKHDIFHNEVITGKAGGVPGGVDIDFSTNQVTGQIQETIPATINAANSRFDAQILNMGFSRIGKFSTGATLTNPRQTILWDVADGGDGQEYGWSGSFLPAGKVVPPSSTPNTTGGIGVGSWLSRFDPMLRGQTREAARRSYAEAGFNLVDGSFQIGFTLANSNDVAIDEVSWKAFYGPAGTYLGGTSTVGFVDVSTTGLFSRLTNIVTVAGMGLSKTLNLADINSTTFSNCVLDFGNAPLSLTRSITLTLNNVVVVGLVLKPTTYTTLKLTGTNYHVRHSNLSGINAPKDYFNKTDAELPLFIASRLEGVGFSFTNNVVSEYVSRQGILVANARDFDVSNNRVLNCWSYKRTSTGGTFDNYGDGIYVTDSVNGFVDDNIVENHLGNPIGRIGVCVEFNCVNVKARGNSICGYDRGIHAEFCDDDIEFSSNNIRGCNFPLVAWNCGTAEVNFIRNTITSDGIVAGNPAHTPILSYTVKALIMSLGDYETGYSNNSGVVFDDNIITTVDGTNNNALIYSENALDVKFKNNNHIRKSTGYLPITVASDTQLRTYFANFVNNKFEADASFNHMDVMDVRNNQFNRLSLFFKGNSLLTRSSIDLRQITDNAYKSGDATGGVLMAGEAQSRFERNTIIMQTFDYVFPYRAEHIVAGNRFVREDLAGFDPKLILASSRYAQGGNAVFMSGDSNVFMDHVLKYSFTVGGSGRVATATHQLGVGMTRPPEFTVGGVTYDGTLNKPVFCKRRGFKTAAVWAASTSYALGAVHLSGGVVYQCIQAGISGAVAPAFNTTEGSTTTDNTVVWCSRGSEALWVDATGAAV